jgi:hypothetical protein
MPVINVDLDSLEKEDLEGRGAYWTTTSPTIWGWTRQAYL